MNDEELRRKVFIKAAREVIKVWPGYADHKFPAPTNRTDQCLFCDLRFSLKLLIETWAACRSGKLGMREFEIDVLRWKVINMHTAEIFNLGKPAEADAVDSKKKKMIEAQREKTNFRR